MFDMIQTGLPGPVQLVVQKGDETIIKDLSSYKWTYKVGLNGLEDKFYDLDSHQAWKWQAQQFPINRNFTWYKVIVQLKKKKLLLFTCFIVILFKLFTLIYIYIYIYIFRPHLKLLWAQIQ